MAFSTKKKLGDDCEKAIRYADIFGRYEAHTYFQDKVKDLGAFTRFLQEETGDPNWGLNPRFNIGDGRDLEQKIVSALLDSIPKLKIAHAKREQELMDRIDMLEFQLRHKEEDNLRKGMDILASIYENGR